MLIEIRKQSFQVQWQSLVLNNITLQKPGEAKHAWSHHQGAEHYGYELSHWQQHLRLYSVLSQHVLL